MIYVCRSMSYSSAKWPSSYIWAYWAASTQSRTSSLKVNTKNWKMLKMPFSSTSYRQSLVTTFFPTASPSIPSSSNFALYTSRKWATIGKSPPYTHWLRCLDSLHRAFRSQTTSTTTLASFKSNITKSQLKISKKGRITQNLSLYRSQDLNQNRSPSKSTTK